MCSNKADKVDNLYVVNAESKDRGHGHLPASVELFEFGILEDLRLEPRQSNL